MFTVVTAAVPARCLSPDRTRHQFTKLSRSGARTPACRITKASYRSRHSAAVPALGDLAPQSAPRGTSGAVRTRPETAPDLRSPLTESNRRPSPYHGAHRPAPYLAQCDAVYWLGHSLGMIKLSEPL